MSSQTTNNYLTTFTFPNPYITRRLNNMDKAKMMKAERNNWTKIYHKTLKGLEAMIDMQKQIKDMLKIVAETNTVKNEESGLNIFYFLSSFLFILFLELGLGLE